MVRCNEAHTARKKERIMPSIGDSDRGESSEASLASLAEKEKRTEQKVGTNKKWERASCLAAVGAMRVTACMAGRCRLAVRGERVSGALGEVCSSRARGPSPRYWVCKRSSLISSNA